VNLHGSPSCDVNLRDLLGGMGDPLFYFFCKNLMSVRVALLLKVMMLLILNVFGALLLRGLTAVAY